MIRDSDLVKQTILCVDDTPENIDVLAGILKPIYKVKVALNGVRALAVVEKSAPDLILLDVMMPEMDGWEVCKRLKANPVTRKIPVIFVTAKIEMADEQQGFELGAVDYITKPVSPPIVLARVKTHLALYDQQRHLEGLVRQRTAELEATRLEIIRHLGRAAEFKDNETGLHVIRMSYYARLIALELGWPEDEAELLMNAAPMHDIGKIGIPDNVLKKPGRLDEKEYTVMKTHAEIGTQIIGEHESELLRLANEVAETHHEKWDGSGYPNGLAGEEIPLTGRICAIADVFDALTSRRPYKEAWPVEKAVDTIKGDAGTHFDPNLIEPFLRALPGILEIKKRYDEAG